MFKPPKIRAVARHSRFGLALILGAALVLLVAFAARAETAPTEAPTTVAAAASIAAPISTHGKEGEFSIPCGDCHDIHEAPGSPLLQAADGPAMCATCHEVDPQHGVEAPEQTTSTSTAGSTSTSTPTPSAPPNCFTCHPHSSGFMPVEGVVPLTLSKQSVGYDDLDSDGNLSPGDRVHYRVDYANPGPQDVMGVTLRDEPDPAHVAAVESITGGGTFNGTAIQWTIGTLPPAATGSVTYDVVLEDATAFAAGQPAAAAGTNTSTSVTAAAITPATIAAETTPTLTTEGTTTTTLTAAPEAAPTAAVPVATAAAAAVGPNDVVNTATLSADNRQPVSGSVVLSVVVPVPPSGPSRYEQGNSDIVKVGTWADFVTASASAGSYGRSSTSGASATVYFTGTRLDWIATKGLTTGIADVYLDGTHQATIDLGASAATYQANVWSTGTLANGPHSVRIVRNSGSVSGKYLTLDAVDIWGTIENPPAGPNLYQQGDSHIVKVGTWADFVTASASGGSYGRSSTSGASATVYFTGTRLDWIAMKGLTTGIADVYLDGTYQATIDLGASVATYQANVWSTGTLANGPHSVRIVRNSGSASGKYLTLDAVYVWGTISGASAATSPVPPATDSTTTTAPVTTTTTAPATPSTTTTSLPEANEVVNTAVLSADGLPPVVSIRVVSLVVPGLPSTATTTTSTTEPPMVPDPSALTLGTKVLGYDDLDFDGYLSPGDRVHYRTEYANPGTLNATGVRLRVDPDAAHLASVEVISQGGSFDGSVIEWNIGTLAAGASGWVTYDAVLSDALAFGGTTTTTGVTTTTTTVVTDTSTTTTTLPGTDASTTTTAPPPPDTTATTQAGTTTTVTDPPATESTTTTVPAAPPAQTTSVPIGAMAAILPLAGLGRRRAS